MGIIVNAVEMIDSEMEKTLKTEAVQNVDIDMLTLHS